MFFPWKVRQGYRVVVKNIAMDVAAENMPGIAGPVIKDRPLQRRLCLFKRDHVSATLGFDQDHKFDPVELELQRVMKASFRGDYNHLTP